MLKLDMLKIIKIFLMNIFLWTSLYSSEPILAILDKTVSNELQIFKIKQYNYECKPYGVTTLEKLYYKSTPDSMCKKSINNLYLQNPESQYFALNLLKIKQMYHLEFKKESCILFAKGEKSLSELLLENGLAMLKPNFRDRTYEYIYKKAEKKARFLKRGLWGENIAKECIVELSD